MPSFRCVVEDCSNASDHTAGISLHKSPTNESLRRIWVKFVQTKRANFNPGPAQLRFMVCSEHFASECFERLIHLNGSVDDLNPLIWKKCPANISTREDRKVSSDRVF